MPARDRQRHLAAVRLNLASIAGAEDTGAGGMRDTRLGLSALSACEHKRILFSRPAHAAAHEFDHVPFGRDFPRAATLTAVSAGI